MGRGVGTPFSWCVLRAASWSRLPLDNRVYSFVSTVVNSVFHVTAWSMTKAIPGAPPGRNCQPNRSGRRTGLGVGHGQQRGSDINADPQPFGGHAFFGI